VTSSETPRELADARARHSIEFRVDSTLFVEAGAGSGKTTALVSRIVQLLKSGACSLDALAAITFTEAGALELRLRVRQSLTDLARKARDGAERQRLYEALDHLDEAAISTIHGFCQRLLAEHPIEAGLPPRIEILDEVRQSLAWRDHWPEVLDRLGEDPGMRRLFGLAALIGVTPVHLEAMAKEVGEEWDRCGRTGPHVDEVLAAVTQAVERGTEVVVAGLDRALALEPCCSDASDRLLGRLLEAREFRQLLVGAGLDGGDQARIESLLALMAADQPYFRPGNAGQRDSWSCDIEDVRGSLADAQAARSKIVAEAADAVLPALVATFDVVARQAAEARRAAGTLAFHDLLVLARDLLVENPAVLASIRRRLRFLLIDEFQDTDPLQLEIAELIGSGRPAADAYGNRTQPPPVEAGRVFFVGDPKQSIYRFRGADLAAYEMARERLAEDGSLALTSNFRSAPGILEFANECFATLMGESYSRLEPVRPVGPAATPVRLVGGPLDKSLKRHDQRVIESEACATMIERAVVTEHWLVGSGPGADGSGRTDSLRPARMSDIAILVPRRTGLDELEGALDAHGIGYRVESASLIYRSQDVRDLLALCRAIDDPGDEVALLAALRSPAFACRDDELYAFRRAGGRWSLEPPPAGGGVAGNAGDAGERDRPGSGDGAGEPAAGGGVVAEALEVLRGYRRRRFELGPVGVLEEAVRDRRLLQLVAGSPRARESWRRVRFLVERARAFVEGGGGGLREFARWVDEQLSEGLRSVESVLPEPDEDVVHILTVHAAKGLEYPIAVLAGFGTTDDVFRGPTGRKILRTPAGGVEVHLRGELRTRGFEAMKAAEQAQERAEAVRVLYVAATRARDHLVICVHHVPPAAGEGTLGQRLHEAAREALERLPGLWIAVDSEAAWPDAGPAGSFEAAVASAPPSPSAAAGGLGSPSQGSLFDVAVITSPEAVVAQRVVRRLVDSPEQWREWQRARTELLGRVMRRRSVRATEVADLMGLPWVARVTVPPPMDRDGASGPSEHDIEPARRRGRSGTQLGRAVHATLQEISQATARQIATGTGAPGLGRLAAAQARAEHIAGRAGEVEELVTAALESPTVRAAFKSGRPRREIYVATTVGEVVLDGYVDLCFEEAGGLTVVDYKTDTVRDDTEVEASAERYSLQAAAYALALGDVTGRAVQRCVLVFLSPPGRPIEFEVPDLEGAVRRVRAAVEAA
jgi:ATP-dependent exoDNAse (exonuclease V) beta subunit